MLTLRLVLSLSDLLEGESVDLRDWVMWSITSYSTVSNSMAVTGSLPSGDQTFHTGAQQ
jgi:hypothetical protein